MKDFNVSVWCLFFLVVLLLLALGLLLNLFMPLVYIV
jgi:hypothetical protein